jgi:hypothetical protein
VSTIRVPITDMDEVQIYEALKAASGRHKIASIHIDHFTMRATLDGIEVTCERCEARHHVEVRSHLVDTDRVAGMCAFLDGHLHQEAA